MFGYMMFVTVSVKISFCGADTLPCLVCTVATHVSCTCFDSRLWQSKLTTAACRDQVLMTGIMIDLASWRLLLCLTAATLFWPLRMVAVAYCHSCLTHCSTANPVRDLVTVHQCQLAGSTVHHSPSIIPSARELPMGVAAAACSAAKCTELRPNFESLSDAAFCPLYPAGMGDTLLHHVARRALSSATPAGPHM